MSYASAGSLSFLCCCNVVLPILILRLVAQGRIKKHNVCNAEGGAVACFLGSTGHSAYEVVMPARV